MQRPRQSRRTALLNHARGSAGAALGNRRDEVGKPSAPYGGHSSLDILS